MTKYYLKMDNIMKNMFVVALNDELQAQSEQDECLEETKAPHRHGHLRLSLERSQRPMVG